MVTRLKIHESAENYLETILVLHNQKGTVRSIDIANELGFSKPSVSVAMKNLRENGYITVSPEGSISLLPAGQEIADKIEHVISAESFAAIKAHVLKNRPELMEKYQ